ncbi:MAG: IS66 family insertion sequence element accessory protein TnpA [Syntrophobacteraceae bacterium]
MLIWSAMISCKKAWRSDMKSNLSRSGKQRFWEEHFAGWESSGVSQVEYCRSHKISLRSFQYFHRKSVAATAGETLSQK